jgi:organic hydroperoxide reductase OsmC/OhrA
MSVDAKCKPERWSRRQDGSGGQDHVAATPFNKELGEGADPEKLFAFGYSARFLGAMQSRRANYRWQR